MCLTIICVFIDYTFSANIITLEYYFQTFQLIIHINMQLSFSRVGGCRTNGFIKIIDNGCPIEIFLVILYKE